MMTESALLEVKNLKQYFPVGHRKGVYVRAVDEVSFQIRRGETFGLVGESGCGKSTVARAIIRLYEPTDGQILLNGQDITHVPEKALKDVRRRMQMVFQDPYASLNSRMTVQDILLEPLIAQKSGMTRQEMTTRAAQALQQVNLSEKFLKRYPHEFSGGQRQRICIARALMMQPELLLCDEAISALDVSIQAQIVNMLMDFQKEMGLTYLFIAHDLSMVRYVSHRVGVMYLGHLMEVCDTERIFQEPLHPYTCGLLSSVPIPHPGHAGESAPMIGEIPSPLNPPKGCPFHPRCPKACEQCRACMPELRDVGGRHYVACHLAPQLV